MNKWKILNKINGKQRYNKNKEKRKCKNKYMTIKLKIFNRTNLFLKDFCFNQKVKLLYFNS